MKKLAKNQHLESLVFIISKKLRTKVVHKNPILDPFSPVCTYPGYNQQVSVADSDTHVTLVQTGVVWF
jgi:hypothetical protein